MMLEALHYRPLFFLTCSSAAIYQPIDFHCRSVFKTLKKKRDGGILYRDNKLININES